MTIAERAKRNAVKAIEYACGRRVGEPEYITNLFIQMATEQKAIDDAELARLKKAWEKEAEVNHDTAMAYKQGYHDAAEHILSQLQDDYDTQSKQDGYKVTCMVSKRHTPQERYERHQGFLSGILVALGYAKKAMEGEQ